MHNSSLSALPLVIMRRDVCQVSWGTLCVAGCVAQEQELLHRCSIWLREREMALAARKGELRTRAGSYEKSPQNVGKELSGLGTSLLPSWNHHNLRGVIGCLAVIPRLGPAGCGFQTELVTGWLGQCGTAPPRCILHLIPCWPWGWLGWLCSECPINAAWTCKWCEPKRPCGELLQNNQCTGNSHPSLFRVNLSNIITSCTF